MIWTLSNTTSDEKADGKKKYVLLFFLKATQSEFTIELVYQKLVFWGSKKISWETRPEPFAVLHTKQMDHQYARIPTSHDTVYICIYIHYITFHYITLHLHVHLHVHIQTQSYKHTNNQIYKHTNIHTLHYITLHYITLHYIHTYIHLYVYIYIYIYIYTYTWYRPATPTPPTPVMVMVPRPPCGNGGVSCWYVCVHTCVHASM